jgi:hypothetical protein
MDPAKVAHGSVDRILRDLHQKCQINYDNITGVGVSIKLLIHQHGRASPLHKIFKVSQSGF